MVMRTPKKVRRPRGFAAMKPEDVLRICTMGGRTVSRNRKHMAEIGAIGGAMPRKMAKGKP